MLNRRFPRRQPTICLSRAPPTPSTQDRFHRFLPFSAAGERGQQKRQSEKGYFCPRAGGVCAGFCVRLGGEYAPRGLDSPSDASRLLQCLAPLPALRLRTPIPAFSQGSLHGAKKPMPVIFCVCVLSFPPYRNDSQSRDRPKTFCGKICRWAL